MKGCLSVLVIMLLIAVGISCVSRLEREAEKDKIIGGCTYHKNVLTDSPERIHNEDCKKCKNGK